jgi:hypothetical protein
MSAIQNLVKQSGQNKAPSQGGVVKGGAINRLVSTPKIQNIPQLKNTSQPTAPINTNKSAPNHPVLDFINNLAKGTASIPVKAALSLSELPAAAGIGSNYGKYEQSGYNIPWLGNTKSYTTDILNTQNDVISGQKPMSSMVGAIAKPIVDLGSFAVGGGAVKGAAVGKQALIKSLGQGGAIAALTQGADSLSQGNGAGNSLIDAAKAVPVGIATAGILHGGAKLVGKIGSKIKSEPLATDSVISGTTTTKIEKPIPTQPSLIQEATQKGSKQRGFIFTMKDSQYTSPQTKKLLTDANYTPQSNDMLLKEAARQIKSDIAGARNKALLGDDNQAVANGMELIKHYQNAGDHEQAAEIAKTVAEKLTEHGRAIQAASLYNKLTPEGIKIFAQKEASKAGVVLNDAQINEVHKMAIEANNATGEDKAIKTFHMLSKVNEFIPSKFVDQAVTVWKAGLLSNPTTHLRNIVGTGGMTGLETGKDVIATGLDKVASVFTGKRTKVLPSLGSLVEGGVQGGKKAITFLKTGADVDNALGKIDYKQVNLPPVLKQYTNGIFRMLGAEDKIFKEALLKKSLHEQAVVDGINAGLKGTELDAHVKNTYNNPTTDMVKTATQEAEYGTFNNSNAMATALNKLKSNDSGAVRAASEFIMPFGRTPANVAGRIFDYSPGGFLKAGTSAINGKGQKKIVEDLSRAIAGTGIMGAGYGLGKAGMMTGNYPTDSTQRAMWDAQNLQPNALKPGDKTYSMNALSPVGNLLGMGSGVQQLQGQVKPEAYPSAIAALGGQTLVNQTFLQGLSGALNALTDPARSAGTWANSAAAGVVPSVIGATAKAIDPTARQTNGLMDAMQAKIPFASQGLMPKYDVLGQQRTNNDGSVVGRTNQFWNPFSPKEIKNSPVIDEIQRLDQTGSQVSASMPGKQISVAGFKVSLTPEEYTKLEQQTGGVINGMLQKVISQPDYQRASDYDKANVINKVIQTVRQSWNLQNVGGLTKAKEQIQKQLQQKSQLNSFYTH